MGNRLSIAGVAISRNLQPRRWRYDRTKGNKPAPHMVRLRTVMPCQTRAPGRGLAPPGLCWRPGARPREASRPLLPAPELPERDGESPPARQRQYVITVVEEDPALEVVAAQRSQPRHSAPRRPPRCARRFHLDPPGAGTYRHG